MKYMLLMYADETLGSKMSPEEIKDVQQAWYAYMQEANASGMLVDNNGLSPIAAATTVRVRNGKTLTTDGPFAETHEQLAGYSIFNCKDLDEAISWATKIPTAKFGSVEVRPFWSPNA
jgi:hypothetical protein